ncbi:MAG TPA: hypothetical protein VI387_02465 [Candidatus Brocadiales bacterium]|nr:hypothetical protein [Candidatus Brocadiales bacterium]
MSILLDKISKDLNIPSEELINRGLLTYLEHEIRMAEEDIADIRDKYLVAERVELEKKIKDKEIYSHPAWEDLIIWENSEAYITKLKNIIKGLKDYPQNIPTS